LLSVKENGPYALEIGFKLACASRYTVHGSRCIRRRWYLRVFTMQRAFGCASPGMTGVIIEEGGGDVNWRWRLYSMDTDDDADQNGKPRTTTASRSFRLARFIW